MEASPVYKVFPREKTIDELLYSTSLWTAEFDFINSELAFIKRLIKAYPFTSTIPNLYEHLQLFILELDNLEKEKDNITHKIIEYSIKLPEHQKISLLESGHIFLVDYEKLAEEVFMYMVHYKNLKFRIFEYINGLID
ncbi:hypothetical protein [Lutibacter sp.]|uniref:hypothetical protein n=1 Tax=Lutibacter sp. TaxID=1925666 RepID=UPI003563DFDC